MRRIAVSLSVLLMTALGVPAAASAATAAPTAPAHAAAAAPAGAIAAMSCTGANSCIGVGDYTTPVKGVSAFLRTWNGAGWGPIFGAVPASADEGLSGISCTSATFCVAVGDRISKSTGDVAALAATWNGSAWSQTVAPGPASSFKIAQLYGVSCATARSCLAVGVYYATTNAPGTSGQLIEGFIDSWNGTKWAASYKTTTGRRGIQASQLGEVSCRSAANCVAVGSTYQANYTLEARTDETYHPVALTWNGRKWTASTVPIPSRGHGALDGVSCWSANRCVAVGNYFANEPAGDAAPPKSTLIAARWNGAKWSVAKLPSSGNGPGLSDVSCVSAANCLAVGTYRTGGDVYRSLADAWNGKTWRAIAVATPKGGAGKTGPYPNSFELTNLTCATTKDCVAFGFVGPLQNLAAATTFAEFYVGSRLSNIADS